MSLREALKKQGFNIVFDDGKLLICKKDGRVCALSASSNIVPTLTLGDIRGCLVLGTDGDAVSAMGPWGTVRASGN